MGYSRGRGVVTDHLHECWVGEVANDVLEDVSIGNKAEGAEDDHDRDRVPDVRHLRAAERRSRSARRCAGTGLRWGARRRF